MISSTSNRPVAISPHPPPAADGLQVSLHHAEQRNLGDRVLRKGQKLPGRFSARHKIHQPPTCFLEVAFGELTLQELCHFLVFFPFPVSKRLVSTQERSSKASRTIWQGMIQIRGQTALSSVRGINYTQLPEPLKLHIVHQKIPCFHQLVYLLYQFLFPLLLLIGLLILCRTGNTFNTQTGVIPPTLRSSLLCFCSIWEQM